MSRKIFTINIGCKRCETACPTDFLSVRVCAICFGIKSALIT